MGCGGSNSFHVNTKYPGQDAKAMEDFKTIELTPSEVNKFYQAFCKFDVMKDGTIELAEFLIQLKLTNSTKIAKEVFGDMDRDGDGDLNFREFVLCVWKYLMRTKESVASFAFDMFDTDNSSTLTIEEIEEMVMFVYGTRDLSKNVKKVIKDLDTNADGKIVKEEFISAAKRFPALLFPAFEMQNSMRKAILGESFWQRKTRHADKILAKESVKKLFAHNKQREKAPRHEDGPEPPRKRNKNNTSQVEEFEDIDKEEEEESKSKKPSKKHTTKKSNKVSPAAEEYDED
mmetsp:Transcript_33359/g.33983  ORF Transcript_33359/g.33983 Transcript_33359/m.33983 type:complete len:288 (-) Transcript_33359:74-937(-)|eukprot:CAMPEP_0182418110 /NCGR_PEP_ID=MMETSP1167-20130531/2575_1 /TAXON_ID=2988 /ORGANISM="Mallomonas Sp, Strain CCMP3275" /LENGTH=287 /DNA_ID=CAMNT_0024592123 /DNA_START=87 /DNA_END=950 /DNA_ORIENTATION=+